jgi:PGAP1-like protein
MCYTIYMEHIHIGYWVHFASNTDVYITMHPIVHPSYVLLWLTFVCCNITGINALNTIRSPIVHSRTIHDRHRRRLNDWYPHIKQTNQSWKLNNRKIAYRSNTAQHSLNGDTDGDADSTVSSVSKDEDIRTEDTQNRIPISTITTTTTTTTALSTNEEETMVADDVPIVTSTKDTTSTLLPFATNSNISKRRRVAILVCPAQFCVPADYESLFTVLKEQIYNDNCSSNDSITTIGSCEVCHLPRTEWIKVAQQLPTMNFVTAQLPVEPTLYWYFQAIESSLNNIIASEQLYRTNRKSSNNNSNDDDFSICVIGHSIGGWVARAYLGGLSLSSSAIYTYAKQHISSFITLGTPHISPSTALVDQTRGLLAAIAATATCTPQSLIDTSCNYRNEPLEITCVGSSAISGKFITTNIEELVAASSYLPLTGKGNGVIGDGIVPLELAFLDHPAKRIEIRECQRTQQPIRHCHVVPTPWNLIDGYAPSIALSSDTFPSYISDGVVQQWAHCIR